MDANQPTPVTPPPASTPPGGVADNDRIIAALCYPIAVIVSLIVLLTDMKAKPFLKYHAVQALVADIVLWIAAMILSAIVAAVTLGIGACLGPIIMLIPFVISLVWAYQTYQGQWVVIPYLTDFAKKQGWL